MAALAQSDLRIAGVVHTEAGDGLRGLQVVLTPIDADGTPTSGGMVTRAKTNKKGKFTFAFVKPGVYQLTLDSTDLAPTAASVKIRGAERKPVYGPDGLIEDLAGPLDPSNPVIRLGIPGDAFYVDVEITAGKPQIAATGTGSGAAEQIVVSGMGPEVEAVLAQMDSRRYGEALTHVEDLIAKNAELAPLHYLRGFALLKLGRLPDAETALSEALRLDPEIAGASGLLGQVLAEAGRFDEALAAIRVELDRTKEPAQRLPLLLAAGQALLELKKPGDAVAPLEEALAIDPSHEVTQVQLVDAYIQSGRDEAAEKILSEGMEAAQAAALHYNLAANQLRAEEWDRAVRHLKQSLALDPTLTAAHKYLAQAYLAQGKRADAVAEFEAYLAGSPDAGDADQTRQIIAALRQVLEEK